MAGDLIPPPSPAGRPEPDSSEKSARESGGLWAAEGPKAPADPAVAAVEETTPEPDAPAVEPPFRARFGFVMGVLIGVALAAVGLGVIMATDEPEPAPPPDTWSAWQPSAADRIGKAKEIADYVMPRYRHGGQPLVGVTAGDLEVEGVKLDGVALQNGATVEFLEGDAVLYTLNGLGDMGSIISGEPSPERGVLVRREALELALYSFHYIDGLDMVVALLPPSSDAVKEAREQDKELPLTAMLLRPEELRDRLQIPLTATIPPRTPKAKELTAKNPETQVVSALVGPNVFQVTFQQAQDAAAYLVLRPLPKP